MTRARRVGVVAACAAVVAAGTSTPAAARPATVEVSVGVQTPTVRPFADGVADRAVLRLRLSRPARVRLFVADASGRTVRKRYLGRLAPGLHRPTWDARRAGGSPVPTGSYRVWFRAYKDGYSSVRSRTRTLRVRQERLVDRQTTITVRGGDFYDSSGPVRSPSPDGTVFLGHGTPDVDRVAWRSVLPDRANAVRARWDLRVSSTDGPAPSYGYLVRAPGGRMVWEDVGFDQETASQPGGTDGPWIDAARLPSPDRFGYRLTVDPFWNLRVVRVEVDVRYRALVPA